MEHLFILRTGMAEGSCGDKAEISTLDLKKILHELMRGKAAEKGRMVAFIQLSEFSFVTGKNYTLHL